MTLKEELLKKGIAPDVVEEMILLAESGNGGDAIEALQKALNNQGQQSLFKAEDEDDKDDIVEPETGDDDDDDEYDESYMKKNMKRFMSENSKACKKMMEDMGAKSEKLEKAISDIDSSSDGAIVAMEDLNPVLSAIQDSMESLTKAIFRMNDRIDEFSASQYESFDLLQKASSVTLAIAENVNKEYSQSTGRKGGVEPMAKAYANASKDVSVSDKKLVYSALRKAIDNGNREAGQIMSVFESSGMNLAVLRTEEKQFIKNLLEGK